VFCFSRLEHLLFVSVLLVWTDMFDYSLCVKTLFVVYYKVFIRSDDDPTNGSKHCNLPPNLRLIQFVL
jgi:hypothetical protein